MRCHPHSVGLTGVHAESAEFAGTMARTYDYDKETPVLLNCKE